MFNELDHEDEPHHRQDDAPDERDLSLKRRQINGDGPQPQTRQIQLETVKSAD